MEDKKQSDFLWKIVLTGDSFVGKTTIRKRAMGEHFAEEYISTVGADFSSYKLKLGDLTIGFQVWDLAGQDKYKYIRSSFYGGATGCFLVFDVTNPKSLKNLSSWVDEAIRYSNGTIEIFVICANKIDLKDRREITRDMGEKYAQALRESSGLQCEYIETSALTGENIDIAFDMMAKCLLEREGISPLKPKEEISVIDQPPKDVAISESDLESVEVTIETPATKVIDTVPSTAKSLMIEDEAQEETERLIAEVMTVLDETDEIIVGRERTKDGERIITVSKSAIEEQPLVEKEEAPKISSELEKVLVQINSKLDTLTDRLKDLEEEMSYTKTDEYITKPIDEEIIQPVDEEQDESIDVLTQLPLPSEMPVVEIEDQEEIQEEPIVDSEIEEIVTEQEEDIISEQPSVHESTETEEEIDEKKLEQDQRVLESLLETTQIPTDEDEEEEEENYVDENIEKSKENNSTSIRSLTDIPDDELVEIPGEEPLLSIEDEDDDIPLEEDDGVIGTELSSAMISELKDMSKIDEEEENIAITQPLALDTPDKKHQCPICGEDTKYIRQYKKHYCVKCGRYII
ncbi:MAG: GTP-binding protein [Asgard group archaeon]|nr:GTP-binding protein [Asgard group archaeon]